MFLPEQDVLLMLTTCCGVGEVSRQIDEGSLISKPVSWCVPVKHSSIKEIESTQVNSPKPASVHKLLSLWQRKGSFLRLLSQITKQHYPSATNRKLHNFIALKHGTNANRFSTYLPPCSDTPKPIRLPLWKGSIQWECVIHEKSMLSLFLKWLKEFFFPLTQSCFRKQSSVWKLAFLCRSDSLIGNDCGNCAICSTLVTFNAPGLLHRGMIIWNNAFISSI